MVPVASTAKPGTTGHPCPENPGAAGPGAAGPGAAGPGAADHGLRADAERNRERILDAAREVFAEQGLEASTNEVARRAGVGVATLFRRFPTRDDLVGAVFADKMAAYAAAIDEALAKPDPWDAFCGFITRVCQMQADDRGFADVLTITFPTAKALEAERDRSAHALTELLNGRPWLPETA